MARQAASQKPPDSTRDSLCACSPSGGAFGLLGAAAAWSLQLTALSSIGGAECNLGDGPTTGPLLDTAPTIIAVINIAALLLSAAGLWISYRILAATGHLSRSSDLLDAGEGRTPFLAVWGIFASLLFFLAVAFNTLNMLWSGLCDA